MFKPATPRSVEDFNLRTVLNSFPHQMMVVGGGPIGLRTAIEAQLLGSRVTVIEKRTSLTRYLT